MAVIHGCRNGHIVQIPDPSERQVAHTGTKHHGQEHPPIVRHDNQHQEVGHTHLQQLEQSLEGVQEDNVCFGHRRSGEEEGRDVRREVP